MVKLTDIMGTRYLQDWHLTQLRESTKELTEIDLAGIRVSGSIAKEFLSMQERGVKLIDSKCPQINEILNDNIVVLQQNKELEGLKQVPIGHHENILQYVTSIKGDLEDVVYYLEPGATMNAIYSAILLMILAKDKKIDFRSKVDDVFTAIRDKSIMSDWHACGVKEYYQSYGGYFVKVSVDEQGRVKTPEGLVHSQEKYVELYNCIPVDLTRVEGVSDNTEIYIITLMQQLIDAIRPSSMRKVNNKVGMKNYLNY